MDVKTGNGAFATTVPMAQALVDGGVRVLEVTLRTPIALQCMEAIARAVPGAILGAGTVRSAATWSSRRNPFRPRPAPARRSGPDAGD